MEEIRRIFEKTGCHPASWCIALSCAGVYSVEHKKVPGILMVLLIHLEVSGKPLYRTRNWNVSLCLKICGLVRLLRSFCSLDILIHFTKHSQLWAFSNVGPYLISLNVCLLTLSFSFVVWLIFKSIAGRHCSSLKWYSAGLFSQVASMQLILHISTSMSSF